MRPPGYRVSQLARAICVATASGAVLCTGVGVSAGTLSPTYFNITVENGAGTDSWAVLSTDAGISYDAGTHTWSWSTGLHSFSNGATLNDANLSIQGDPEEFRIIGLSFSGNAGSTDTTFTILTFDSPLVNPDALASPSLSLTSQGAPHTASVTGAGGDSGTNAYAAYYNGVLENDPPDGSQAYELLPGFTTDTSGTQDANTGFNALSGSVSSMQVQYDFLVSAGDQVSGSSNFVITPEPAGCVLFGAAVLVACRRRRR
jgi:hypothetical protein